MNRLAYKFAGALLIWLGFSVLIGAYDLIEPTSDLAVTLGGAVLLAISGFLLVFLGIVIAGD